MGGQQGVGDGGDGDWDPLEKCVGSKELVQKEKMFLSPTKFSHKKAYCQRPAIVSRGHKFTHQRPKGPSRLPSLWLTWSK